MHGARLQEFSDIYLECVLLKKVKLNEFLTKIDFPMAEIFDVVYPKFCKFVNVILPMIDDDLRDFFSSSKWENTML